MTDIELPPGHSYAAMWDIPDDYSGMTNAMLHRSQAFIELADVEVTILTYAYRDDYDAVRARLRERGAMVDGMHLRNLWEDLRGLDDTQLKNAVSTFAPGAETTFEPLGERGDQASPWINKLFDEEGRPEQTDYYRADGTLMLSDRRRVSGDEPRAVTLCDTSGEPLGTWRHIWNLYWFWLDSLPRDPIAWIICDSKTSANHLVDYRRDDVVTMHVVHGSHLEGGTGRPMGELSRTRRRVMKRLDQWDAAIFLTQQQLGDVDALLGPASNRHVIPNGRFVPADPPHLDRSPYRGAMLSALIKRKQVSHAVKAMNRVGRVRGRRVWLDVWGQGTEQEKLQKAIDTSGSPVTLRGYSSTAVAAFETASFSLLTSRAEGLPLVLAESMGRGCISISYDIPYGPADIITDGVDGFLVKPDDINGLATVIRRLVRSSRSELAEIRRAAHRRATEYNDETVTQKWATVMNTALAAKQA